MAFPHNEQQEQEAQKSQQPQNEDINVDAYAGSTPVKYASLDLVYSATSPCLRSSNVTSKKIKARKLSLTHFDNLPEQKPQQLLKRKPAPIIHVYSRRHKKPRLSLSVFDLLVSELGIKKSIKTKICEEFEEFNGEQRDRSAEINSTVGKLLVKKRRFGSRELAKLGVDSSVLRGLDRPRLRVCKSRNYNVNQINSGSFLKGKHNSSENCHKSLPVLDNRKWVRLGLDNVDPETFIGLQCKVYWPLDADWFSGHIVGYDSQTNRHHVNYEDGDKEDLILANEKIKFYISAEEMQHLNLSCSVKSTDGDGHDYNEMVVLAASLDDCKELEPGDIIWAKLTGYAMWPAIIVDESLISDRKGLTKTLGARSILVQFFGTHDFARTKVKQVISFLKGLLSSFHLKCKKPGFVRSLEEAKLYLSEQKLPRRMVCLQNGIETDDCESVIGEDEGYADSGEDCIKDEGIQTTLEGLRISPFVIGDLQIISLGNIVKDLKYFHDDRFIWPEGYTAVRKFKSITDPSTCTLYKMEVLRDAESQIRPLFRVTLHNGEQFKGSTPSACWNKIYRRLRKMQNSYSDGSRAKVGVDSIYKSGSDMFGFSNPEVLKLIQELSKSRFSSKFSMCKLTSRRYQDLPIDYRPVCIDWKDLDKCSVCHMDEEYENNLFLQCDKCRMMVHARCYGELEPVDGVLWLCNLCRPGSPDSPPRCCLCPVIGGAMKLTTDGRWAHLACAIWIPETCLSDIKRMEPIDGLSRISKDRWKLLCSICGVYYGACIQCSNNTCRVAYHPLCARAAGFCVEPENEDTLDLISVDEDEDDQCINLLSFCKKHRQPSNEHSSIDDRVGRNERPCSNYYTPPCNPSGCARSEPYDYFGRRGRKEPEALAAASLKRLFVENRPYLVSGYCQHETLENLPPSSALTVSKFSFSFQRQKDIQLDPPKNILSMAEKYIHMRETFRKRLAFGKSRIHGFGIFAKHPHKAGDMVIEYTGELVRPSIADRREHFIYNSLVGAGTYMFRIDDEQVIDATRAGSIAHLINHSCEPNCYSRVISVNGYEHIIIFAKRDISQWEELTYDYRFFSIDERLACYCGFPRCRGVVNDFEAEEQVATLYAPRCELIDWRGD